MATRLPWALPFSILERHGCYSPVSYILHLGPLGLQYLFLGLLWTLVFLLALSFIASRFIKVKPPHASPTGKPAGPVAPDGRAPLELLLEAPAAGDLPARSERIEVHSARITIGRSADSDLKLEDEFASSNHAVLYRQKGALYLDDLDSKNGTFVNEKPVGKGIPLHRGDTIRIGKTLLRVK